MANVAESLGHILPDRCLCDTWCSDNEHAVTHNENFGKIDALLNETWLGLTTSLKSDSLASKSKLFILSFL